MAATICLRVEKHRAALRASGLRPVQIWLPDTRRVEFAEEGRRQSLSLCDDAQERETLEQLAAVADTEGWQ